MSLTSGAVSHYIPACSSWRRVRRLLERPMASNDPRFSIGSVADVRAGAPAIDQGLRAFMLAVYNHMALGVAITGAVALGTFMMAVSQVDGQLALTAFGQLIYRSPLKYVVMLA